MKKINAKTQRAAEFAKMGLHGIFFVILCVLCLFAVKV